MSDGAHRTSRQGPTATNRPPPTRPFDAEIVPVLDGGWPPDGFGPIATIVAQLPDPTELPDGAIVVVREKAQRARGMLSWLAPWRKARKAHAAVRCTALLACGYREISTAIDPRTGEELAWGVAFTSGRSSSAR